MPLTTLRHPISPRWLVEHGKTEEAFETLQFYREGYYTSDEVRIELSEIERSVAVFRISGLTWVSLFTNRSLFARLWRAALLQFMAQMCGATAMKYYLPALFKALGFGHRVSLLAGGIESTLKTGCTVIEMLIIDRVGRRLTLIVGAIVMSFALLVSLPKPGSYRYMSDLMLTITEDQRRAASGLPHQHKQSGRLHMCRFHFYLRPGFQYGIWSCRLGLRL
jgi:MFS family permease